MIGPVGRRLSFLGGVALAACLLLTLPGCPVTSNSLQPWPGYPSLSRSPTFRPWLIVKCTFADEPNVRTLPTNLNPAIADLDTYINLFLTNGGAGTGNLTDYFDDTSYGAISFSGSRVYGWYPAPFPKSNTLDRATRAQQCVNSISAADAKDIDFGYFYGVIAVTNDVADGGACGIGPISMTIFGRTYNKGCVVLDPGSMWTAFAPQEIGHGLGLQHSWDTTPCQYCDPYDQMSGYGTYQFNNPNYPPEVAETGTFPGFESGGAGPGFNVPNLLALNAIPATRLATYTVGSPRSNFGVTALSHPSSFLPLAVEIVGSNPNDIFTVEYRQADGWDAGLRSNAVMIHEYKSGSSPYSYLQKGSLATDGRFGVGTTWTNASPAVSVTVLSIDATQGIATFSIGP